MNEINSMKITGITLENFRNHTATEHFDLGDMTYITGHNGTGKTTMAHAVCYALYGVSFYGEQKIERLQNSNADGVKVQLTFKDQDGAEHNLVRNRVGDKISIMYDGYSIPQSRIEQLFGDKNSFIAMFNPTYLTENIAKEGRELILRHLKPISKDEVISNIPSVGDVLSSIDLEAQAPEKVLENTRAGIRRLEQQIDVLEGNISAIKDAKATAEQKLKDLYDEKNDTEAKIQDLKQKQFDGIDLDDISIQRDVLSRKLKEASAENPKVTELREKLAQASARVYVSKFADEITKARIEYKSVSAQYKELAERIKNLKVGDTCPTCKMTVTEANFTDYKNQLNVELKRIAELGNGIAKRGKEATELDKKAKETFEQYKADDISKLTAELEELKADTEALDAEEMSEQIDKLDYTLQYGNLSEEELSVLNDLNATLIGINAHIEAAEESADTEKIKSALEQKDVFQNEILKYKEIVGALKEYIFKRAELATKELQMPNVSIRLFEIIRTTGEIKSTFKFEYKGREYSTLSLSEKMLAGIEISAMMRSITNKDYPICIDNTESIAEFNNAPMPSQVLLLRVVKGQKLTVQFQNNNVSTPLPKAA